MAGQKVSTHAHLFGEQLKLLLLHLYHVLQLFQHLLCVLVDQGRLLEIANSEQVNRERGHRTSLPDVRTAAVRCTAERSAESADAAQH